MRLVTTTLILVFFLLGDTLAASPIADPSQSVTVTLPSVGNVAPGGNATLDVLVSDLTGENVTSFEFRFEYDPAAISITAVKPGDVASGMLVVPNLNEPGVVRVAAAGFQALSGAGQLVTIDVEYIGSRQTDLHWKTFTFNTGTPASVPVDGVVSVSGSASLTSRSVAATTAEDTEVAIALSASDPQGDIMTFAVASTPANGSVTIVGGRAVYQPNLNFAGTDSFTYTASDGSGTSSASTVTVTVTPVNDAPTAADIEESVSTGQEASITLQGSDAEGDALTYTIQTAPTNGTVTISGDEALYTSEDGFEGTDTFTYTANDGALDSNEATVTLSVIGDGSAPVAVADAYTTAEDQSLAVSAEQGVLANDSDADNDPLTAQLVSTTTKGQLALAANGSFSYTPSANVNGTDTFRYRASDGSLRSATRTVTITITAVNDAPVAADVSTETPFQTAVTFNISATDVESQTLSFAVGTAPSGGTLSLGTPARTGQTTTVSATYTPADGFSGADAFSVVASDGEATDAAAITVTVAEDMRPPTATAVSSAVIEDTPKDIQLTGSDPQGDALTFEITSAPTRGSVVLGTPTTDGGTTTVTATYTPEPNYNGNDSFTYQVTDGSFTSDAATVTLNVNAVNDAPTAAPATASTPEETAVAIPLTGTDIDGQALTFSLTANPENGSVAISEASFDGNVTTTASAVYTPNDEFGGTDSFSFTVSDGALTSPSTAVTVTVTATNDAPEGAAAALETNEDEPVTGTLSATDADGEAVTFAITTPPASGTAVLGEPVFDGSQTTTVPVTYTPSEGFNGTDTFAFEASDGTLASEPVSVAVTVISVNDAPVAADVSATTDEDQSVEIELTGTDSDGEEVAITVEGEPSNGALVVSDGAWDGATSTTASAVYTPNPDFFGEDTFTYSVTDGTEVSALATVTITVTAVNDAPVAETLTADLNEDDSIVLTLAATDVDNDTFTFAVSTDPANGSVAISGDQATYTPNPDYNGPDVFNYVAGDGTTFSEPATVSLNIVPTGEAMVQLVHNAPDASIDPVDIWVNGEPLLTGVSYQSGSGFLTLLDGDYEIELVPAGEDVTERVLLVSAELEEGVSYTLIAAGTAESGFTAHALEGTREDGVAAGAVDVLFYHGIPNAGVLDVEFLDETRPSPQPVVSTVAGLSFGTDNGAYQTLTPDDFNVRLVSEGSSLGEFRLPASMADGEATLALAGGVVGTSGAYAPTMWLITGSGSVLLPAIVTSIDSDDLVPRAFQLRGNYPNPFNPTTSIQFDLPEAAEVIVSVHDMLGRQVIAVPARQMSAGVNRMIPIDAGDLTSGIYVYRVVARMGDRIEQAAGTMTLLR